MNLQVIRKYRIQFESWPIFNNNSFGIALFDLATAFIGAWILDISFNLSSRLPICKNKRFVYYLLVIPVGIIVHHIIAHAQSGWKLFPNEFTYLNKKLFTTKLNRYHLMLIVLLAIIFRSC